MPTPDEKKQVIEKIMQKASISGIIMIVSLISTIMPYVLQILEALNTKKAAE